jgi:transcriptional regulator with GAF, ATPase, and Fis domain
MLDEENFFKAFTLSICSSLDIQKGLDRCLAAIGKAFPCAHISIQLPEPELNKIHLIAISGLHSDDPFVRTGIILPPGMKNRVAHTWQTLPKVSIIPDLCDHPHFSSILDHLGINIKVSAAILKVELENNRISSFWFAHTHPFRYTERHGELLKSIHDPLAIAILNSNEYRQLKRTSSLIGNVQPYNTAGLGGTNPPSNVVGENSGLKNVMDLVHQVAIYNSPVLISGETGVGKEIIANAVHNLSKRRNGPFIKVNCGAIPDSLVESELFGHEKGAFTGAHEKKIGRFERAQGGTIFLDEISEMSELAQIRMLRVLQNKEIERIGGTQLIRTDVRVIAATNKNLKDMVSSGRFREDLWFRLNIFPITIPPLRHRKEDIPLFVDHFIEKKCRELFIREKPEYGPQHIECLINHDWPGNVRELENIIERALISYNKTGTISWGDLSESVVRPEHAPSLRPPGSSSSKSLDDVIVSTIREALILSGGKINGRGGAAEILKLHPNTLRNKMIKYGLLKSKDASGI